MASISITTAELDAMLAKATQEYELAWDSFVNSSLDDTDAMYQNMERAELLESHAGYIKYVLDYAHKHGLIEFIPQKWMVDMLGL